MLGILVAPRRCAEIVNRLADIIVEDPLILTTVPVCSIAQFRQDPLIYDQMVDARKGTEIGLSEPLRSAAGYPLGTRPISKGAEPIKV